MCHDWGGYEVTCSDAVGGRVTKLPTPEICSIPQLWPLCSCFRGPCDRNLIYVANPRLCVFVPTNVKGTYAPSHRSSINGYNLSKQRPKQVRNQKPTDVERLYY